MTSPSELGAYLQRHREEREWSLEQAEEITNIRRHYLVAMEAGDWDNLPPAVYTRGLLRNYSRALGVSQASIMRMHAKERPHEARLPEPQLISQPLVVTSRFNFELIAAIALLFISAALIAWVVRSQLPGALQDAQARTGSGAVVAAPVVATDTPTPDGPTDTPAPTREPRRTAAVVTSVPQTDGTPGSDDGTPGTDDGTAMAAAGSADAPGGLSDTPSSSDGTETSDGTADTGRDVGRDEGRDVGTRTPTRGEATDAATPRASVTAGPSATATIRVTGTRLVMDVSATSDAWIQVYVDGEVVYRDFLRKGQRKRWSAKERVGLRTGNAGGTVVKLNGQELEPLGGNGEVVEYEWRLLPSGDVEQRQL